MLNLYFLRLSLKALFSLDDSGLPTMRWGKEYFHKISIVQKVRDREGNISSPKFPLWLSHFLALNEIDKKKIQLRFCTGNMLISEPLPQKKYLMDGIYLSESGIQHMNEITMQIPKKKRQKWGKRNSSDKIISDVAQLPTVGRVLQTQTSVEGKDLDRGRCYSLQRRDLWPAGGHCFSCFSTFVLKCL